MADKVERKQGEALTREMDTAEFTGSGLDHVKKFCGGLEQRIQGLNPSLKLTTKLVRTASDVYCVRVGTEGDKPFASMDVHPSKKGKDYGAVQKFETGPSVAKAFAEVLGGIKPSSDGASGGVAYTFTEVVGGLEQTSFEGLVKLYCAR